MNRSSLGWLTDRLPTVERIDRRSEADYYGASHVIAAELGYRTPPRSIASWKHGVLYEPKLAAPDLLLTEGNRATRHLVATAGQVALLRKAGFARVHAVGLPYLYVPSSATERIPGSLLIMPAHSLAKSTGTFDEHGYARGLSSILGRFKCVAACVNAACVQSGRWIRTFDELGIPWFIGADSRDRNALRRIRAIFDTFEYMTTNALGSHVAYAAYSGCKVSIWGPFAEPRLEDYKNLSWYRKHWDRAAELMRIYSEAHVRSHFGVLFREPWSAADDLRAWSAQILGEEHKRPASEVARLLGWSGPGRAEALVHGAASRCRRLGKRFTRTLRRAARRAVEANPS